VAQCPTDTPFFRGCSGPARTRQMDLAAGVDIGLAGPFYGVRLKANPFLSPRSLVVALGAILAMSSGAANAVETTFIGCSEGCFAVSPATTLQAATAGGPTHADSNFDVTTVGGFVSIGTDPDSPDIDNLGSSNLPFLQAAFSCALAPPTSALAHRKTATGASRSR
jgi:hypothetical protein